MARSRLARTFFLFFALLLPAGALPAPAPGASPQATLRIGILAPLSGPFASGGSSFLQAATLAAERANSGGGVLGRHVELEVADTQGRVDVAKSEALRLISREKVFALVGAYLSEETVGAIEAAAPARRIIVVPVAATSEITD
ncbi:MAG TPA: ABC transporter substrate-binding protein, partial [Candidatus Eisenbacteria bacterium]